MISSVRRRFINVNPAEDDGSKKLLRVVCCAAAKKRQLDWRKRLFCRMFCDCLKYVAAYDAVESA